MSDSSTPKNRIPFETIENHGDVTSWALPDMGDGSGSIKAAKKKPRRSAPGEEIIEDYSGDVAPKPMTAEDLKKMADEAQKEGYDEGYQEGLSKGLDEGNTKGLLEGRDKAYNETKANLDDERARLAAIASSLLLPYQEQEHALENIVVDLAMRMAKDIVFSEIQHAPTNLYDIVNKAMSALPVGAKNIMVYLNEHDAQLMDTVVPEKNRDWTIKIDPKLSSGGCRVETLESLVDYSIDTRFERFKKQIMDKGDVDETQVDEPQDFRPPAPKNSVVDNRAADNEVSSDEAFDDEITRNNTPEGITDNDDSVIDISVTNDNPLDNALSSSDDAEDNDKTALDPEE